MGQFAMNLTDSNKPRSELRGRGCNILFAPILFLRKLKRIYIANLLHFYVSLYPSIFILSTVYTHLFRSVSRVKILQLLLFWYDVSK